MLWRLPHMRVLLVVCHAVPAYPPEEERRKRGWKPGSPTTQTDPPYKQQSKVQVVGAGALPPERAALLTAGELARFQELSREHP